MEEILGDLYGSGRNSNVTKETGNAITFRRTKQGQKRKIDATLDKTKEEGKSKGNKRTKRDVKINCVDDEDVEYVFNVNNDNDPSIKCKIGGVYTDLLVDSGCKPNLITVETWEKLKKDNAKVYKQVQRPTKRLIPYGTDTPLKVEGSFEAAVTAGVREIHATFYVINGGTRDLLGRDSATELGVLKVGVGINQVDTKEFPKFKDVVVEIPIDEKIKPVAQPYRRIPIPLEKKVNEKIQELLDSEIIEEVKQPSRWVSPMVPILKENGELRLCVDMRRANAAILRENHPLPTMDNLLPKIGKAKFFTKLDIKNAFHQIELHADSRHITTFITSKGLFQYKRLMFGITCAPEVFQKILERMVISCEGVINFIDDILVFGSTEEEHDSRVEKVLRILEDNNVLLNDKKCIRKVQKVEFLGHELTPEGIKPLKKYIDSIEKFGAPNTVEELQSFLGLIVEHARPQAVSMRDITEQSAKDTEITNVKSGLYGGCWDDSVKEYKIFESELCFYDDILLRGNRIVIPLKLRKAVLEAAHEGHPGIVAMKGRLRSKVWWPRIDRDAENLVKSCKGCTLVGAPNPPVPMKRRELPSEPWVDIAIDLLGPLPSSDYLLVIVDYYSRYKEVKVTKNITSSQIIKILDEMFSRLGYPVSITADNGRQFISQEFKSFLKECNITLFNTVPYWPQQNGEVERQNRDILKRLKIGNMEKKDLKKTLFEYLLMCNATPHSTTKKSPSELFFGRKCRDKIL
ncbi:uncharacterized protein K02A2.6-like [Cydia amplana]|uniref:uncharacterized protein K02A2.6-like n=1 Tax=Cydia amplana TaxID=1869771 RepID=UPI002FE5FE5A